MLLSIQKWDQSIYLQSVWGHNSFLGTPKFLLSTSRHCVVQWLKAFSLTIRGYFLFCQACLGICPAYCLLLRSLFQGFSVYTLLDDEGTYLVIIGLLHTLEIEVSLWATHKTPSRPFLSRLKGQTQSIVTSITPLTICTFLSYYQSSCLFLDSKRRVNLCDWELE